MTSLFTVPRLGPAPAAGDKLYFYQTGTTTPQNTYSDSGLTSANSNPVVADSNGLFGPIYLLATPDYKAILKTSADVTKWTTDPLLTAAAAVVTTRGDMIVANALGAQSRLPIGTAGKYLRSDGTDPSWSTLSLADASGALPSTALPAGTIVQVVSATDYVSAAGLSTHIPTDDTIPQVTEGTEILTVAITPKSTTNKIRVRFTGSGSGSSDEACAALFRNGATNAIACVFLAIGNPILMSMDIIDSPASVSAQTYSIRVGANSTTMTMNTFSSARVGGGTQRCTLILEEIVA